MVRSYGTILLDAQVNQPSQVNNDVTEYKIDVDHYNKTGEIKKIGAEEVVPTIDQLTAGKKLREEIKTIEDFVKVGTYQEVAKQYGVSVATAHGLMMHLKAMEGVEPEPKPKTKAQIMREEVTTLELFDQIGSYRDVAKKYGVGKTAANDWQNKLREDAGKMEQSKGENTSTEGQEPCLGQGKDELSISLKEDDSASSESGTTETQIYDQAWRERVEDRWQCVGGYDENNGACTDVRCPKIRECKEVTIQRIKEGLLDEPEHPCFGTYENNSNTSCGMCVDGERCRYVTENPPEEIKDDLKVTGPEKPWKLNLPDEALDRIIEELNKPVTDDQIWQGIEEDLNDLRERAHKRADQEIANRFLRLMNQ